MITASDLIAMTDNEIATHASGGYGPAKRNEIMAAIRRAALAECRENKLQVTGSAYTSQLSEHVNDATNLWPTPRPSTASKPIGGDVA